MTTTEQIILKELATLPKERWAAVLAYVRYLKFGVMGEGEIEQRFEKSLKSVRARAKKLKITQEDIDAEIRAVREVSA